MVMRLSGCVLIGCVGVVVLIGAVLAVGVVAPRITVHDEPPRPETTVREHDVSGLGDGGVILVDVGAADLTLVPVDDEAPLRVTADFDASNHRFEEELERVGEGWDYRVRLEARKGWWSLLRGDDRHAALRIEIPYGIPFHLVADLGTGTAALELGGLAVRSVELDLGAGECEVVFSEPVPEPMEEFSADAGVGELGVHRLGNASPSRVSVDQGIGEARLDLTGAWRNDSEIRFDFGIGEGRVVVPREVAVVVEEEEIGIGSIRSGVAERLQLEPGVPTLTIRASGGIGELRIEEAPSGFSSPAI